MGAKKSKIKKENFKLIEHAENVNPVIIENDHIEKEYRLSVSINNTIREVILRLEIDTGEEEFSYTLDIQKTIKKPDNNVETSYILIVLNSENDYSIDESLLNKDFISKLTKNEKIQIYHATNGILGNAKNTPIIEQKKSKIMNFLKSIELI